MARRPDLQPHSGEAQVPVTGNVEDMIINIESHASSISTDMECVLERALSDRDWLEPELRPLPSLSSEPGTR